MTTKKIFKEQEDCFIFFNDKPSEAYILAGRDRNGYYYVCVQIGGLGGCENAELPVHESLVFSNKNECLDFYIDELNCKLKKLEALRSS